MGKNKTIAIVTNNYKPYSGGVVSSIVALTKEERQKGNKVFIITLDFLDDMEPEEGVIRIQCPLKFRYHGNYMAVPWRPKTNICEIIEEIKPDLIHSQHPFFLGVYALKAARCLKIPIHFTYHTQYEKYVHYLPFPERVSAAVVKQLVIDYCNKVDKIIAPTKSIQQFLKNEKVKTPIKVSPTKVDPIFIQERPVTRFKKKIQLITVSRFAKEKNIPFLLEVFSKLDFEKFDFTLVGYGPEEQNLKQFAKILKIPDSCINFVIAPAKEKIAELYRQSDLFIFASTTETQGIVLNEALASKLPIIAVDAFGSCDIVQHGKNGYLVKSQEKMIQKINLIFHETENGSRLIKPF